MDDPNSLTREELIARVQLLEAKLVLQRAMIDQLDQRLRAASPAQQPPVVECFSGTAQRIITHAREQALRLQRAYVEPEHILLAIVSDYASIGSRLLTHQGIAPAQIHSSMTLTMGRGESVPQSEITLTSGGQRVIEFSLEETRRHNEPTIHSGHLLIAVAREDLEQRVGVLAPLGVTPEGLRAALDALSAVHED